MDGENSISSNVEVVLDFLICYRVPSMLKPLVKRKFIPVYNIRFINFVNFSKLLKFVYTAENEHWYQPTWWFGKCISFQIWLFWVSMLNYLGVSIHIFSGGGILKGVWYVHIIYPIVSHQSRVVFLKPTHGGFKDLFNCQANRSQLVTSLHSKWILVFWEHDRNKLDRFKPLLYTMCHYGSAQSHIT